MIKLTEQQANTIYDILVAECGAPSDLLQGDRASFVHYMTSGNAPRKEWRFSGLLGFGGKCRINNNHATPHVDYYREDSTPKRDAMVARANARIEELFR